MGGGSWTATSYVSHLGKTRGFSEAMLDTSGAIKKSHFNNVQDVYKVDKLHKDLKPYKIMRECLNTEEHPNTKPVILAIDVTGSMGEAAIEVARTLNPLMTELYKELKDVEFSIMGIGDLAYDDSPIQMSQFESDVRIAEHLDKIYFEHGGGGNDYESYTSAWYMGLNHTKLDAHEQGRKGLIITIGDEQINPYLPKDSLERTTGASLQDTINTPDLYNQVKTKFHLFHIQVEHDSASKRRTKDNIESFAEVIGRDNVKISNINSLKDTLKDIILSCYSSNGGEASFEAEQKNRESQYISW